MKLPNGGAKIMLERRDGLFFLPVYRTDAKAAPGLVSQVRPGVGGDRPVTSPRDVLQIDRGFLLWLHRLEQL